VGTVLEVIASAPPGAPSATSGVRSVALRSGIYADSVRLMQVSRDVSARDGVTAVLVAMATPLNLELAANMGLSPDGDTSPEQLLIAIRAQDDDALAAALTAVDAALAERERSTGTATAVPRRTVGAGLDELGPEGPALAIVSVPGQYAVAEAADAIAAGRSVLVFSDGVPVEHEVALKRAAHDAGVLVMGPDCGTAIVSGVALGFANVVRPGPVGLVAASGTGAQQVSCLLDMAGVGVSHVLGVGGRDLSEAVGGLATLDALAALDADPATERVMLVSKPPALGDIRSNTPLRPELDLALDPSAQDLSASGHVVIDFGDDALTVGRAHPMIDPTLRLEALAGVAASGEPAVLLMDVVLGYGADPDPAGALVPALSRAREAAGRLPVVIALVGTEGDPQGWSRQADALAAAGAAVFASNAAATRYALDLLGASS
jgi:FdrA protein